MIVVGLTGGIGSGKTTVSKMFKTLGVPVYIADIEAKRLMNTSKVIKRKLIELFGAEAYLDNQLNKSFVASRIFNDAIYLKKMNAIVHPKVGMHFKKWLKQQNANYIIKEAAIIFEQNMQSQYDFIITVTANEEEKIARILKRDNTSRPQVLSIMKNQMSDAKKIEHSDFVIVNDHLENTENQVLKIHQQILRKTDKP